MGKRNKTRRLQRARRRMLAADPRCHWCHRELVDQGEIGLQATIDHLDDRNRPGHVRPGGGSWVLACRPCNEARSRENERSLGIEELRRRSQQHDAKRFRRTGVRGA